MPRRGRDFIHLPGPTNIPERILRAMHRPSTDFAGDAFLQLARQSLDDLSQVFQTKAPVYAFSANGHGAWEVALTNLLMPGDTVLMPETGRFSRAWAEMAASLGIEVQFTPDCHDRSVDPTRVEEMLRADRQRRIKAVLMVHVETSTGVTHDVEGVRRAIDAADHSALLVVDAIASLACMDLPMDAWGIDLLMTASQKGLMMPPGLAFVAVGERARHAGVACEARRRYWDWRSRAGDESYQWFYGTPPIQMMYGLREALDLLFEEGLRNVFARHRRLAGATRAAVARWGEGGDITFQCQVAEHRSDVVTALRFPSGADPEALRTLCRERLSVAFGGGIGPFAGQLLRIGHLGDLNEPMLLGALGTLELAMRASNVPHTAGGVDAAAQHLADTLG